MSELEFTDHAAILGIFQCFQGHSGKGSYFVIEKKKNPSSLVHGYFGFKSKYGHEYFKHLTDADIQLVHTVYCIAPDLRGFSVPFLLLGIQVSTLS